MKLENESDRNIDWGVLGNFGKVRYTLAATDSFSKVVKMTPTRLWNTEFTRYSPSGTHQICLNGLERRLGILGFRPTKVFLIVEALATQAKLCYGILWNRKADLFERCTFNYVVSNHIRKETMQNVSAYQLYLYYRPHLLPTTSWTASVTW